MEVIAACCGLSDMASQGDGGKVKKALKELKFSIEAVVTFIYR
jgi:hypothetical protein